MKKTKGQEVLETNPIGVFDKPKIKIEILEIKEIKGGIELLAKAWREGKQLGFGKDGTVDIERFRIFNPPVLVDNPNGTIIREWADDITGEIKQRKLKEDPKEALLQSLEHTIKIVGKENSKKIKKGKKGNTTSTFYPSAGDVSPSDASTYRTENTGETFSTIRAGVGTGVSQNSPTVLGRISADGGGGSDQYDNITRGIFGFDTSSLGSDTIDSATFSLYGTAANTDLSQSLVIDRNVPASASTIASSDFNVGNWDGVEQSSTRIADSSWNTSDYNNFTLNGTGEGNINGSGLSWFGTRVSSDFDNSAPTWTADTDDSRFTGHQADTAGTANDPKLVVEHTTPSTQNSNFLGLL